MWLGRAELLQSLLGSGIIASLDDIADKESSTRLRDRLVSDERYSMAVYTCRKCKIDAFPVWVAWGHALVRMEHYAQARVKFKQALQQYKGDAATVVTEIINTIEGGPPVDVSSVRSMYEHLAKSAATIFDDSLSADAYLNVLYMPSTFPRSESSRQSRDPIDNQFTSASLYLEDGPRSNLDSVRYAECIHYLHDYARPQMLAFMFRHGHYAEACSLFFPFNQPTTEGETSLSSVPWSDPLTTDYGTIDDLCDLCLGYGAMAVLENTIRAVTQSPAYHETPVIQYMNTVLTRICNYCETHRHFNYLYNFLVLSISI
jgi:zinc finger FYVE domain-containing protein 26